MSMNLGAGVNGGGSSGVGFSKRGTKRDHSDSNSTGSDIERFEKRLRMLSLRMFQAVPNGAHAENGAGGSEQNGHEHSHLYTPVSNATPESTPNGVSHPNHVPSRAENEFMQVDDTRDRVYIHDLDKELEDVESNDGKEKLIFLPDIEKHFSKLPHQVLTGSGQDASRELVLYSVPKSLSVDEGHDSVRKAIIEARQRAREKAVEEALYAELTRNRNSGESTEGSHEYFSPVNGHPEYDPDAMDIG